VHTVGEVCDRRPGPQRKGLVVTTAIALGKDPDQPGQPPDRLAETVEARVVEHRDGERVVVAGRSVDT